MNNIDSFVDFMTSTSPDDLTNYSLLENCLFQAGLNDEHTNEQPPELSQYFGTGYGLKIWQYPNQFVPYLLFLGQYKDKINSYLEIGSRHGGTFIFTNEFFKTSKQQKIKSLACDLIEIPPNISRYKELNSSVEYWQVNSQSSDFKRFVSDKYFSLILIDGDHLYHGVKNDSEACLDHGDIIVFHDITSISCLGTSRYWIEFKNQYSNRFNFYEFTDQYPSVGSQYLGIGCAVRKEFDLTNINQNNA
jgi:hypothetical protein